MCISVCLCLTLHSWFIVDVEDKDKLKEWILSVQHVDAVSQTQVRRLVSACAFIHWATFLLHFMAFLNDKVYNVYLGGKGNIYPYYHE